MLSQILTVKSDFADKLAHLHEMLRDMRSAVIAFSGGADSTLLSVIASEVLGDNALIIFAESPVVPGEEQEIARRLAKKLKFNYLEIEHDQLTLPDFVCNNKDRCYHCKLDLHKQLNTIASTRGIKWVCEGSNYDDLSDYRPGLKAVAETGVRSPLAESFITKSEIRSLARKMGLDNWDKPASPCLSSRVPYGTPITLDIIDRIEKGEACLKSMGIKQVRLRHHGDVARIEVGEDDIPFFLDNNNRQITVTALKKLGYKYITVDLQGFRSGSLNEVL
ncbi:MAG: ATP-dependent sacrificial sulfur transferase LarE [Chloroflexi bacterium]|nr:ATP-dependent sacrificial sulfur transferase LarE [Chloroflexota bacterium]